MDSQDNQEAPAHKVQSVPEVFLVDQVHEGPAESQETQGEPESLVHQDNLVNQVTLVHKVREVFKDHQVHLELAVTEVLLAQMDYQAHQGHPDLWETQEFQVLKVHPVQEQDRENKDHQAYLDSLELQVILITTMLRNNIKYGILSKQSNFLNLCNPHYNVVSVRPRWRHRTSRTTRSSRTKWTTRCTRRTRTQGLSRTSR